MKGLRIPCAIQRLVAAHGPDRALLFNEETACVKCFFGTLSKKRKDALRANPAMLG